MPGLGPALLSAWCGDMAGGAGEDVGTDVVAVTVDVVVAVEAPDDADGGIGPLDCIELGKPPNRPPAAAGDRCGCALF